MFFLYQEDQEPFVCITNYQAQNPGELSVTAGQIVFLLDNMHCKYCLVSVENTREVGWIPTIFVTKAADQDLKKAPKNAKGREREALNQRE